LGIKLDGIPPCAGRTPSLDLLPMLPVVRMNVFNGTQPRFKVLFDYGHQCPRPVPG